MNRLRLNACVLTGLALLTAACGGQPKAQEVCVKLEAAGVATNCRQGKPTGVYSNAKEVVEFEVPGASGKGGVVLTFGANAIYDATIRSYTEMGSRNADHVYGSRPRLVFVAIDEAVREETAEKAKGVIDGL